MSEKSWCAPRQAVERRSLRSIFSPKAGRVLRVLLEAPKATRRVQDLAIQAEVSIGLAFKVKQRLLDLEYASEEKNGVRLTNPEQLLRAWGENYSYLKNPTLDCYGTGELSDLEQALGDYARRTRTRYALALFSGAARVAPFARSTRGFAYVEDDPVEVARSLSWKPVPSGANFTLLTPFDDAVWYGAREVDGDQVASDVQLYLDLVSFKGRGAETAEAILEQRLRPQW